MQHRAVIRFAGNERPRLAAGPVQPFVAIETKFGLAFVLVRAVAIETVVRKDRADIAIEPDRLFTGGIGCDEGHQRRQENRPNGMR
jgi:hypothetical protein